MGLNLKLTLEAQAEHATCINEINVVLKQSICYPDKVCSNRDEVPGEHVSYQKTPKKNLLLARVGASN